MPANAQETLLAAFDEAAGAPAGWTNAATMAAGLAPSSDGGLTDALTQVTQVINTQTQATSANTDALGLNSQGRSSGGGSRTASGVVNDVSQYFGGGLSLLPLVSLFSGLFGGGQQQPAPLVPFSLPPSLNLQSTTADQDVSWGENGMPRAASSSPQITVQVQAMDSQSFLDHSNDIAQAVRQAMLNMSSLNDVVRNL